LLGCAYGGGHRLGPSDDRLGRLVTCWVGALDGLQVESGALYEFIRQADISPGLGTDEMARCETRRRVDEVCFERCHLGRFDDTSVNVDHPEIAIDDVDVVTTTVMSSH